MLATTILAAGESRRMGFPKALLPFRGGTFLEHLIEVTAHPRMGARRVVIGAHEEQIRQSVALAPGDWVVNPEWRKGQLSSIRAAIGSLSGVETEGILLALVDHPFVTRRVVEIMMEAFDRLPGSIVIPTCRNRRGHPVIFPARFFPELCAASDDIGARAVVWAHAGEATEVPIDEEGILLDIDDRATFERLFPAGGPG
ncbi:MAG TPA: nucleotidyltransferase family protein [Candidatus Dormibacteraeota bacterium]|nr:nucleotidyltransferase family protein [Candidatus Dormibacteraeota bacterium]